MRTIVQDEEASHPFADENLDGTVYGPPLVDRQEQRRVEMERRDRERRREIVHKFQSSTGSEGNTGSSDRTRGEDVGVDIALRAGASTNTEREVSSDAGVIVCEACTKTFLDGPSLDRHHRNFPVCQQWIDAQLDGARQSYPSSLLNISHLCANPNLTGSNLAMLLGNGGGIGGRSNCLLGETRQSNGAPANDCKACGRAFSSTSALNRHFKNSLVCDRMRASALLDSLAASAQCVTKARNSDILEGKRAWESRFPDHAWDIVGRAGTPH
jgi:hypothetical protein